MGRNRPRYRNKGKHGNDRNRDRESRADGRDSKESADARAKAWELTQKVSAEFEKYYKSQNIVPEDDWDEFMSALKTPLPTTFRITGFRNEAKEVQKIIQSDYLSKIVQAGGEDNVIQPISWYPDGLAWQINCSRKEIRQSENLKKLHNFLISETDTGTISRQEAVSMIPPLLLDIKPHHKVLDMCAAPGSKTAQIVELLHRDENEVVPEGLVIANDSDNKRCYLMVHQIKRLDSPNFIIVNHDAALMPNFNLTDQDTPESEKKQLVFDRILADVPCSGDGTIRKNVDIWKKWNLNAAANLHSLQRKILRRGLEMLEIGGRITYSTCSLNPVEDEAVISAVLEECEDSIHLVDVSKDLPGLKYQKGLKCWKVGTKDGKLFETFDEVPKEQTYVSVLKKTQFPPTPEEAEKMNLDRCLRILPHEQDSGGFFIAVLEKTARLPWMSKRRDPEWQEAKNQLKDDETVSEKSKKVKPPPAKKPKLRGYKEDPFIFLTKDHSVLRGIRKFFALDEQFPVQQMLVRCEQDQPRNIYFTSSLAKHIVECNKDRIKFINMGVKIFSRSRSSQASRFEEDVADFRMSQEGVHIIAPYIKNRRVMVTRHDIVVLLSTECPFITRLTQDVQEKVGCIGIGGLMFSYEPDISQNDPQCRLNFCGYRGKVSCRCYMPCHERAHFLRLFGHELKTKEEKQEELAKAEEHNLFGEEESSKDDIGGEHATTSMQEESVMCEGKDSGDTEIKSEETDDQDVLLEQTSECSDSLEKAQTVEPNDKTV